MVQAVAILNRDPFDLHYDISVITSSHANVAVRNAALDALKSLAGDKQTCTQIQENTELRSVLTFIKDQADGVGETGLGLLIEMLKT
eukprot:scaffold102438_cov38-Cyclotella_meneghiniana.AAC.2